MKELLEKNKWQIDCHVALKLAEKECDTAICIDEIKARAFEYIENYTKHFMFDVVRQCVVCGGFEKEGHTSDCGTTMGGFTVELKQPIKLTEQMVYCGVEKPEIDALNNPKHAKIKLEKYHQAKAECLFDGWDKDVDTGLYYNGVWFLDIRDNKIFVWQSIVSPAIKIQTPHELVTLTQCPLNENGLNKIMGL